MEIEFPTELSEFLLRFSKSNNLSEDWPERFKQVLIRWLDESSDQVKSEFLSCVREVEASTNKPGRVRKFFNGIMREIVKQLDKEPGGKSRYKWADKAFFMRQELKLDYEFIYPAVCQEAMGKRWNELTDCEKQDSAAQYRGLVHQRRVSAHKQREQNGTQREGEGPR